VLFVAGFGTGTAESGEPALYVPDMTEAVFADELADSSQIEYSVPAIDPFWTDLVDTEKVSQDGEGVYVAVLDTGMLPLYAPFFFSEANVAWHLGKGFTHDVWWDAGIGDIVFGPLDDTRGFWTGLASGHGTHVASTVVGYRYSTASTQAWIMGVAPKATIIPVLVLDAWLVPSPYGTLALSGGTDEMISAGIYYVADLAETLDGPVVINMSLGGPTRSAEIEAAVDYAISQGVVVVASAGNVGTEGMGYPGGLDQIISAGAAGWAEMFYHGWTGDAPENLKKKDDLGNKRPIYLEDFSSRPNKDKDQKTQDLDVTAPGAWIVGPYKDTFDDYVGYFYVSGTSMAAPHVSGMAALVLQDYRDTWQWDMEFTLENAAHGNPFPSGTAIVAFPFIPDGYYTATWKGGDYGSGFLQADQAMGSAKKFLK
jgi:subtilisin family serine protease